MKDVAENYLVQLPTNELLPTFFMILLPHSTENNAEPLIICSHLSILTRSNHCRIFQIIRQSSALRLVKYGDCVQTDVFNCHHLFSLTLGMYRCMQQVELGCWYQHEVRDSRRDQMKKTCSTVRFDNSHQNRSTTTDSSCGWII
ncbi:unnamed protein product [Caenorhabditis nigoni]